MHYYKCVDIVFPWQQGMFKQGALEELYDSSDNGDGGNPEMDRGSDDELPPTPPRPASPVPVKGLPWTPKIRYVKVTSNMMGQKQNETLLQ